MEIAIITTSAKYALDLPLLSDEQPFDKELRFVRYAWHVHIIEIVMVFGDVITHGLQVFIVERWDASQPEEDDEHLI